MSTYYVEQEMIGDDATAADVRRMVELLQERGIDAEAGSPLIWNHDREAVSDTVWQDCLDILSHEKYAVAAATLGRRGGQSTSAAKQQAARENGRKGGRPRNHETVLQLTAGTRTNPVHASVEFSGKLTAGLAVDAARRAFGHADGVVVFDSRDGTTYRCSHGKARKSEIDPEWYAQE